MPNSSTDEVWRNIKKMSNQQFIAGAKDFFITRKWETSIALLGIFIIALILWYNREEKPSAELIVQPTEQAQEKPVFTRTDTIDQVRYFNLMNSTSRDLLQVYLSTWNIVPPAKLVENKTRYWAFLSASSRDLLKWVLEAQGYRLVEKEGKISIEDASASEVIKELPSETQIGQDIRVEQGKLGTRTWEALKTSDLQFLLVLPEDVSAKDVSAGNLNDMLLANNLRFRNINGIFVVWQD